VISADYAVFVQLCDSLCCYFSNFQQKTNNFGTLEFSICKAVTVDYLKRKRLHLKKIVSPNI